MARDGVKPVFVSPGHRIGHETAVEIVLGAAPRYRLPEPIRQAYAASRRTFGVAEESGKNAACGCDVKSR